MKQLWAPWRMAYIGSPKEAGCIFCDKAKDGDLRSSLVLAQTSHSLVMLNKFPYSNGHLLLAPKRHTNQLSSLRSQEYWDLSQAFRRAVDTLSRALKPGGFNLGMNLGRCAGAGVEDHLHWHVVPRWEGDTNFMPVMDEVRLIPQHLMESYDQLKPYFVDFLTEEDNIRQ